MGDGVGSVEAPLSWSWGFCRFVGAFYKASGSKIQASQGPGVNLATFQPWMWRWHLVRKGPWNADGIFHSLQNGQRCIEPKGWDDGSFVKQRWAPQEYPVLKTWGPILSPLISGWKKRPNETHLVQAIYFGVKTHVTPFRTIGDGPPILWGFLG